MPDFRFDGMTSGLAEIISIPFVSTLFSFVSMYMCVTHTSKTPQTTDSTRAVLQPAGYNVIHDCRLRAYQEVTPHACGSFYTLYYCGGFFF